MSRPFLVKNGSRPASFLVKPASTSDKRRRGRPRGSPASLHGEFFSGPADEVAGRLFEPFVTAKAHGVGLGLVVARQAFEGHGGWLDWRREEGATCYRFELPTRSEWPAEMTAGK
jgi:hypothetical protein